MKIKFGMKIPIDHNKAIMFDADNEKTNCKDSDVLELNKIYNFNTF